MKIAVLGTGVVGKTLAGRLVELGHDVVVGTRDPAATLARTEPDVAGGPPFAQWRQANPAVGLVALAEAAGQAELIVNATNGIGSMATLEAAGEENLAGKVLMDIANPLDFSRGLPPSLFVVDTDSLGEQIQRRFPRSKVVKTLNTMAAELMVHPGELAGGQHTAFVSGDDPHAKEIVFELLASFGHSDVIDLGDITTARGAEMYLPLWLRVWGALGTRIFNIKVVR
jgi:hypothetical protein